MAPFPKQGVSADAGARAMKALRNAAEAIERTSAEAARAAEARAQQSGGGSWGDSASGRSSSAPRGGPWGGGQSTGDRVAAAKRILANQAAERARRTREKKRRGGGGFFRVVIVVIMVYAIIGALGGLDATIARIEAVADGAVPPERAWDLFRPAIAPLGVGILLLWLTSFGRR